MQNYSINEKYIATEGQRDFTINKPFIDGAINVYLNGVLQTFGDIADYVTSPDNGLITFNKDTELDDLVSIETIVTLDSFGLKVISYGKRDTTNALYQRYTSVEKLKSNNRYKVHIKIDDKDIDWQFVTRFTPMFCTVKKILEDIGEFIQGFTEEYISSIIHRNSWEIVKRIKEAAEDGEKSDSLAVDEITQDVTTGEYISTYRHVNNWVKLKTDIDLIYARYFGLSYDYGSISKTIGDITIEKTSKLPYIDELLKRLIAQFAVAEEAIFGGANFVGGYVKGSTNYTYSERSSF